MLAVAKPPADPLAPPHPEDVGTEGPAPVLAALARVPLASGLAYAPASAPAKPFTPSTKRFDEVGLENAHVVRSLTAAYAPNRRSLAVAHGLAPAVDANAANAHRTRLYRDQALKRPRRPSVADAPRPATAPLTCVPKTLGCAV